LSCEDRKSNLPFLRTNKLFHGPRKSGLRKKGWTLLAMVRKETKRERHILSLNLRQIVFQLIKPLGFKGLLKKETEIGQHTSMCKNQSQTLMTSNKFEPNGRVNSQQSLFFTGFGI
jgi:hypothetical protein